MSGRTAKATRRDIRRAFGAAAVATVAALDTRLRQAEAEIVALRLVNERQQKEIGQLRFCAATDAGSIDLNA